MDLRLRELALTLFRIGAIEFKPTRLKSHETDPTAPLSPIYFNLRTPQHRKPGPLTEAIMEQIGIAMYDLVREQYLQFFHLAGVPDAGDAFAAALQAQQRERPRAWLVRLKKTEGPSGRRVSDIRPGSRLQGESALVVDDVVTKAGSIREAVHVLRDEDLPVTDAVVLVDREQGGRVQLERENVSLYSVFKLTGMLDLYVAESLIEPAKQEEVLAYIAANTVS